MTVAMAGVVWSDTCLRRQKGIFRDAVPSRYVAIRQPSLKIRLDFMALGVAADVQVRAAIDLPGS